MLRDLLRWLRAPLAPTAVCDALACLLLAQGAAERRGGAPPLGLLDALALAATSLLVYAFGMGLNDWADRERDRERAPDRPLPAGRIAPGTALTLLALLALGAVALGGGPRGDRGLVIAALAAAALYDLALKHALVPGALSMGLVRALNAATGAAPLVLAGAAPAWTLAAPALIGLYSAGVLVLSSAEDLADEHGVRIRTRVARAAAGAAYLGTAALAALAAGRLTLAGALIAPGSVLSLAFGRVPRAGPVKRQVLEMLLGLYLLAALVAGGAGDLRLEGAFLIGAFALIYLSQQAIRALRPR